MFLRDDIKKVKTDTKLVPYCRDCKSKRIKTIQFCLDCVSYNIANPMDIYKYDDTYEEEFGKIDNFKEEKAKIYKCDLCGNEFDGLEIDNYISYADGMFSNCNYKNFSDYDSVNYINYKLPIDLCFKCKNKMTTRLMNKFIDFTRENNIQNLIKEFIEKDKKSKVEE